MMKITMKHLTATNDVVTRLNNLRRWTDFTTQAKYNEEAKQSLNCILTFVLANKAEHEGKEIRYEHFPRIAIGRAFAKVYVYFDTPEHKIQEICDLSGIKKRTFDKVAKQIICEKSDQEFANFLADGIGSYETRIYKAATKIATYIELLEQQTKDHDRARFQEIERALEPYMDIPGVAEFSNSESEIFKLFQQLSKLRNQVRWATCSYTTECSVLGHLFDTALFAYLTALDESNFNEEYATNMFFIGIFHDVAEAWTKDIPSPIKDRIEGFRKATEVYEVQELEKHMYSKAPEYLVTALKSVMMEDAANERYKKFIKAADYLSADSECYRNLVSGTRDIYFCDAIINRNVDKSASELYNEIRQYFISYAEKCKKNIIW